MVTDLKEKVAVVTGATRGIGYAIAYRLLEEGSRVMICGRDEKRLEKAARQLEKKFPGRCRGVVANVSRYEDCRTLIGQAAESFGGIDLLVNNAGFGFFKPVDRINPEEWDDLIGTNLNGVFYCCRAAIPIMRRRGGGWIVNVSSLAGSYPFANGAAYCASKAGLDAFTAALMQEVRFDGIRVSAVAPGSVGTAFAGSDDRHAAAPWKLTASDVAQVVVDLLSHDGRSLPSRVEIRPSQPRKG